MTESYSATLPPARRLDRSVQIRLIALAAVAFVAIMVVGSIVRHLTARPRDTAPAAPPGGGFRPTRTQAAQLTMTRVGRGEQLDQISATGSITVDGDRSTPIVLPFSGQIGAVLVEAGDRVARGQPLMRVTSGDLADARNALATAEAQLASATEQARLAQVNADRQKAIYSTAGGALKDYQQSQAEAVSAAATARSAAAAVAAARGRLLLFSGQAGGVGPGGLFRSPVSGLVADRQVAPGQFVTAGSSPLMTITDPSTVWLIAQLPEDEAAQARIGDAVTVTTPALPGRSFAARIDNVAASLDPTTRRLAVRATVSNPDGALKPQMFAAFTITRRSTTGENALLLPAGAVIYEGDGARVWVMDPDGVLRSRTVTVGATENGRTRILTGLHGGERVVTAGAIFVNEAGQQG